MKPEPRALVRIAFLSVLIMFLEMLLVRWVGTELRVFAYLQNAVLIAAFLGLGLGCRNAREPAHLLPAVAALTSVALVIRDPWHWEMGEGVTQGLIALQDSAIWAQTRAAPGPAYVRTALVVFALGMSLGLLGAIAYSFRPLGQWLGAWMDAYPDPIAAYTANILGSLAGIALFLGATVARTPPWAWLAVSGCGLAACAPWAAEGRVRRAVAVGLALALPLLAWNPRGPTTVWSPYQKLSLSPLVQAVGDGRYAACGEVIRVNNFSYQSMIDLDPIHMAEAPQLYPPAEIESSHYILPYQIVGPRERVLVVGAGSGNDVAAALRAGARSVRAVEIDPMIVELGRALHPNHPYSSERVDVTIDDARAFFRRDSGPYDLVWFGLLDSHTTPSAYANVRLDHFVYTRESFADMKRLLAPSGVVVLFFEPQAPWIAARLIRLLQETFGVPPLVLTSRPSSVCLGWGGLMLLDGSREVMSVMRSRVEASAELRGRVQDVASFPLETPVTTDDWAYLYLPRPGLPRYHLLVGGVCLALGLMLRRGLFKAGEPMDGAMLLLGMGFMLLEVSAVSRAALLFGSTWTVNAYGVGAIFAMILLANLLASRTRILPTAVWPGAGLAFSVLALALVPTSWLAALPLGPRVVAGSAFLALPIFFSGLIFVSAWASVARKDLALGSNLLGSLLGGVSSMLSMAVGFRGLMFLTLAVYLAALIALRRGTASRGLLVP